MKKSKDKVADKSYKTIEQWRKDYLPGFDFGSEDQSLKLDEKDSLSSVFNKYLNVAT